MKEGRGRLGTAVALAATLNGVVHNTEAHAARPSTDVSTPAVEHTENTTTIPANESVQESNQTDTHIFRANFNTTAGLARIQDYELRGYTVVQSGTDADGNTVYKAWHPPKPTERKRSEAFNNPELHAEYVLGSPDRQSAQEMDGYAVDAQGFVTGTVEEAEATARKRDLQEKIDNLQKTQEVEALLEEASETGWTYQERIDIALETEVGMRALEIYTSEVAADSEQRELILEDLAEAIAWANAGAQNAVDENTATDHALNAMCLRRLANTIIDKYEG